MSLRPAVSSMERDEAKGGVPPGAPDPGGLAVVICSDDDSQRVLPAAGHPLGVRALSATSPRPASGGSPAGPTRAGPRTPAPARPPANALRLALDRRKPPERYFL